MGKLVIEYDIVYGKGIVINGELFDRSLFRKNIVYYLEVGQRFTWAGVEYGVVSRTYDGSEGKYLYTFECQDMASLVKEWEVHEK